MHFNEVMKMTDEEFVASVMNADNDSVEESLNTGKSFQQQLDQFSKFSHTQEDYKAMLEDSSKFA